MSKIDVILIIRDACGLGLKAAKDAVNSAETYLGQVGAEYTEQNVARLVILTALATYKGDMELAAEYRAEAEKL